MELVERDTSVCAGEHRLRRPGDARSADPVSGPAVLEGRGDSSRGRRLREPRTFRACCRGRGDDASRRSAGGMRLRRAGRARSSERRRRRDGRVACTQAGSLPRPVAGAAYGRRDPGCARGWGLDQAAQTPQRARWRPVAGDHAACCGRAPVAARARRRALGPSPDRGFRSARGREAAKGRSPAGGRRRAQGWILTVGDGRAGSRAPYAGSADSGRCPAGRRRPGGRWCASAGAFRTAAASRASRETSVRAGDARMLMHRGLGWRVVCAPVDRELSACWNLLTRFWYVWCIIGVESNHWL